MFVEAAAAGKSLGRIGKLDLIIKRLLKGRIFQTTLTMNASLFRWFGRVWKLLPKWARLRLIRSTQTKFLASIIVIITDNRGRVLLLDHVLRPASGWGLPGGFIEAIEQPENAAVRELKEEVDLELANLSLVQVRNRGRHLEIIYRAEAVGEPRILSREITRFAWLAPNELPQELSPDQRNLIATVLRDHV